MGAKGGEPDLHLGVQEDGIAMKGAQSKVKWWGRWGWVDGLNGGSINPIPPLIVTPLGIRLLSECARKNIIIRGKGVLK